MYNGVQFYLPSMSSLGLNNNFQITHSNVNFQNARFQKWVVRLHNVKDKKTQASLNFIFLYFLHFVWFGGGIHFFLHYFLSFFKYHYVPVNQANWCNMTFTVGNLSREWPESSPHQDSILGPQHERWMANQLSYPSWANFSGFTNQVGLILTLNQLQL